ncbi:hypothetical protein [Breoghania sp. L-A4]|uniref:hypothetical protein n=1 Tax=Breoghania sp. L-A4 TaxID=2304600 RepID=UPI000E35B2C0|nr:hypothetical protein [Breoghania sp. L-A4]AXS38977.1 hypothetical protein D1F64_01475 [Breoghania sp. L-A4]
MAVDAGERISVDDGIRLSNPLPQLNEIRLHAVLKKPVGAEGERPDVLALLGPLKVDEAPPGAYAACDRRQARKAFALVAQRELLVRQILRCQAFESLRQGAGHAQIGIEPWALEPADFGCVILERRLCGRNLDVGAATGRGCHRL